MVGPRDRRAVACRTTVSPTSHTALTRRRAPGVGGRVTYAPRHAVPGPRPPVDRAGRSPASGGRNTPGGSRRGAPGAAPRGRAPRDDRRGGLGRAAAGPCPRLAGLPAVALAARPRTRPRAPRSLRAARERGPRLPPGGRRRRRRLPPARHHRGRGRALRRRRQERLRDQRTRAGRLARSALRRPLELERVGPGPDAARGAPRLSPATPHRRPARGG